MDQRAHLNRKLRFREQRLTTGASQYRVHAASISLGKLCVLDPQPLEAFTLIRERLLHPGFTLHRRFYLVRSLIKRRTVGQHHRHVGAPDFTEQCLECRWHLVRVDEGVVRDLETR